MSNNAHIWRTHGITEDGYELANGAMKHMLRAFAAANGNEIILRATFEETCFQIAELPHRASEFQTEHTWHPSCEHE